MFWCKLEQSSYFYTLQVGLHTSRVPVFFIKNTQIRQQQEFLQACSNFSQMLCILNLKNVIKAKNNQVNYFSSVFILQTLKNS